MGNRIFSERDARKGTKRDTVKDTKNLPQLPVDIIIMIAEKCCEITPTNGIKMWLISKKLHKSSILKRYYFIARRLLLQKFLQDNYSPKSSFKSLNVTIINTEESEYNYYTFLASEPGLGWLESTDDFTVYILDKQTKLIVKNDIYNFDKPFVTIRFKEVFKEIKVSKIMRKNGYLVPSIQICRGFHFV